MTVRIQLLVVCPDQSEGKVPDVVNSGSQVVHRSVTPAVSQKFHAASLSSLPPNSVRVKGRVECFLQTGPTTHGDLRFPLYLFALSRAVHAHTPVPAYSASPLRYQAVFVYPRHKICAF